MTKHDTISQQQKHTIVSYNEGVANVVTTGTRSRVRLDQLDKCLHINEYN